MNYPNNISNSSSFGLQSNFLNTGFKFGMKTNENSAYYAKKGEPMYIKDMDADEDGIVSFDEFKDYCQENNISPKEMVKMVEMANSYRTMQAQKKASKEVSKKSKDEIEEPETEFIYAKRGDSKYDEVMDTNNDDKITYKEYIEYCRDNAKQKNEKSQTKVDDSEENEFKTKSIGKAINSYSQAETESPESIVDDLG